MLKDKQRLLFNFLRQAELSKQKFGIENVAAASNYLETTVKTYFSKMLIDKWVFKAGEFYEARGIASASEMDFAEALSQVKNIHSSKSFEEWRDRLSQVVFDGVANGFPVSRVLREFADEVVDVEYDE